MALKLIDTHAHVFHRALPMVPGRRYTPHYDAPLEAYLAVLDQQDVTHGVIVQPSFLGTDNRYLLSCLRASKGRLRGIAVVTPTIGEDALEAFAHDGVVGIRFNMIGDDPEKLRRDEYQALLRRVTAIGWQIEVQAESRDIGSILKAIIVIDHFGKPDAALGVKCPGLRRIMAASPLGNIWVKLSAPYRVHGDQQRYADWLLQFLGPDRLIWGSDWPWTQNEAGRDYASEMSRIRALCHDDATWHSMHATAAALFGFKA
jgi:predicted TIM-barrel fold metal-dependent hydrolase